MSIVDIALSFCKDMVSCCPLQVGKNLVGFDIVNSPLLLGLSGESGLPSWILRLLSDDGFELYRREGIYEERVSSYYRTFVGLV